MDVLLYLTTLALGFFIGVTTIVTAVLRFEQREMKKSRDVAVQAFADQFNVSYEEADASVVTDPYWPVR